MLLIWQLAIATACIAHNYLRLSDTRVAILCDCLSKNPPSLHLLVFQEIHSIKNNQPCLGSGDIH